MDVVTIGKVISAKLVEVGIAAAKTAKESPLDVPGTKRKELDE